MELLATRDQALHDRDQLRAQLADLQASETESERVQRLEQAWQVEEELGWPGPNCSGLATRSASRARS